MHQPAFPGMPEPKGQSRADRLVGFLRMKGFTLLDLAARWEVHKTFPGKCLVECCDPLPAKRRRDLVDNIGVPESLLPPPPPPKEPRKKRQRKFISPFDKIS